MGNWKILVLAVLILSSIGQSSAQVDAEMRISEGEPLIGTPNEGMTNLTPGAVSAVFMPSVFVADQVIDNGTVTINEVRSSGPGWVVIHAEANGAFGPVIGHEALIDGNNTDVVVAVQMENVTNILYAMLHTDEDPVGSFDFPGADAPVRYDNGTIVMERFAVTFDEVAEIDNVSPMPEVSVETAHEAVSEEMQEEAPEGVAGEVAVVEAAAEEITAGEEPVGEDAAEEEVETESPAIEAEAPVAAPDEEAPVEEMAEEPGAVVSVEAAPSGSDSMQAEDQDVSGGQVTVAMLTASGPGWVAVHKDLKGRAWEVIGYVAVGQGTSRDLVIPIDPEEVTPVLHIALHKDAGTEGRFEYPGPDVIAKQAGEDVIEAISVTGGTA